MSRISDNLIVLSSIIVSLIGWLITFIGAIIFRRGLSGGSWWIIVYELLLIFGITTILVTNTYTHYRFLILTFLAISISLITYQLDYALPTSKFTSGYRGGAGAYATGYILIIMIQFIWVIIFGSEPDSFIGKYAPSYYGNTVGIVEQEQQQQPPLPQPHYETTADKIVLNDPTSNNNSTPINTEYKEKVKALHAYNANAEDPTELSFAKGEILEVVDRNGNWWQARKSDGSVGIIPSNYFGPSL